jgi:arylsulfatase
MWKEHFLKKTIANAYKGLKPGKHLALNVANTKQYKTFEEDTFKRSVDFITRNAKEKKPFFLYWASNAVSYFTSHPDWEGKSPQGTHSGDQMMEHDYYVGQILRTLEKIGIAENTLVVWMSDNGPMYDMFPEASYTAFRGGKGDVLEGGVHVPAVAWWPGVIKPSRISADMIHVTDFYTTAARIGGVLDKVPDDRIVDGIEQSSYLIADSKSRREYMFHYSGNHLGAVRIGQFKRHIGGGHGGLPGKAFFDIYKDPKEENGVMVSMLWAWVPFDDIVRMHNELIEEYPHRKPYRSVTD